MEIQPSGWLSTQPSTVVAPSQQDQQDQPTSQRDEEDMSVQVQLTLKVTDPTPVILRSEGADFTACDVQHGSGFSVKSVELSYVIIVSDPSLNTNHAHTTNVVCDDDEALETTAGAEVDTGQDSFHLVQQSCTGNEHEGTANGMEIQPSEWLTTQPSIVVSPSQHDQEDMSVQVHLTLKVTDPTPVILRCEGADFTACGVQHGSGFNVKSVELSYVIIMPDPPLATNHAYATNSNVVCDDDGAEVETDPDSFRLVQQSGTGNEHEGTASSAFVDLSADASRQFVADLMGSYGCEARPLDLPLAVTVPQKLALYQRAADASMTKKDTHEGIKPKKKKVPTATLR